jgi:predicted nucleic acid-binding protein
MVMVDSSVWIDALRKIENEYTKLFAGLCETKQVVLSELVLFEVLSGIKPESRYDKVKDNMLRFPVIESNGIQTALHASENSLKLQKVGQQITGIDCIITTICLDNDLYLLTKDKVFMICEKYLGLKLITK